MIVPTAYLAPASYFKAILSGDYTVEQMETFEKQTFRNRCLIRNPQGGMIRLSVPVGKVEHKQLTRDIRICYQSNWQHQHWIALESAYRHKPFFMYYEDYFRPHYERQYEWLLDLNDALTETLLALLNNHPPGITMPAKHTADWSGQTWTDRHPWQNELSIIDLLSEKGPETIICL